MFTMELKGEPRRRIVICADLRDPAEWKGLIADAALELHEAGGVEFVVSGFGQERWPLDVGGDLNFVLWEIEDVVSEISRGDATVLDFFEQGRARRIEIVPEGSMVHLECHSYEDHWIPEPPTCSMERALLLAQLRALVDRFVSMLSGDVEHLVEWRQRIHLG
jgi:hypothetical protein